jgi:hypothetical protein
MLRASRNKIAHKRVCYILLGRFAGDKIDALQRVNGHACECVRSSNGALSHISSELPKTRFQSRGTKEGTQAKWTTHAPPP